MVGRIATTALRARRPLTVEKRGEPELQVHASAPTHLTKRANTLHESGRSGRGCAGFAWAGIGEDR